MNDTAASAAAALLGTILEGKYRVLSVIGQGGMGAVYEAEHVELPRHMAIKVLWPRHVRDPEQVARFQREAEAAAKIGHDNICEVIDVGHTPDGAPYLVMPLLKGRTLAAVFAEHAQLSLERAVDIGRQTLSALRAAHAAGIVHRDLKPENLFITRVGDRADFVKILDFGVSKILDRDLLGAQHLTQDGAGTILGTPWYMSPEHARGQRDVDHRTDLWSLGVILYEALTGQLPYEGESYNEILFRIVETPATPPSVLRPDLPRGIEKVILRALERDRTLRFDNAESFQLALTLAWQAASGRDRPKRPGVDREVPNEPPPAAPPAAPPQAAQETGAPATGLPSDSTEITTESFGPGDGGSRAGEHATVPGAADEDGGQSVAASEAESTVPADAPAEPVTTAHPVVARPSRRPRRWLVPALGATAVAGVAAALYLLLARSVDDEPAVSHTPTSGAVPVAAVRDAGADPDAATAGPGSTGMRDDVPAVVPASATADGGPAASGDGAIAELVGAEPTGGAILDDGIVWDLTGEPEEPAAGEDSSLGWLTRTAIQRRFASLHDVVRACTGGRLEQPITVTAAVRGRDGGVQGAWITGSLPPSAVACVRGAILGLSFGPFRGVRQTVRHTYAADVAPSPVAP